MTPERYQALLRWLEARPALKKAGDCPEPLAACRALCLLPFAAGATECPVVPAALRKPRRRSGFYAAHRPGSLCAGLVFLAARSCGPG